MTITRQYYIVLSSALLVVVAFASAFAYQFSDLFAQEVRLIESLRRTSALNRQLAQGNSEQILSLERQFVQQDAEYSRNLTTLTFALGEKYAEYLKLDIGVDERLTVERAKALQSESSLLSAQIADELRIGNLVEARIRVRLLHELGNGMRGEFDKLNSLQLAKLSDVMAHVQQSATRGQVTLVGLVVLLAAAGVASTIGLRRRILGPVHAILAVSDKMRQGDFGARAPELKADEFGQLTRGFNFMAESLADSYASLEAKVEERAKQLQEIQGKLIRAEKMSAVGLLVSGVAHELNNPLAAVRGFAELAKSELRPGGDYTNGISLLNEADSQIERCRRIVTNLLQFARKQEPHKEAVRVNGMIDQVLQLREYELGARNIVIVREFDPADPIICVDRDRIQQVVLNLLNNAYDAIREANRPGTVWVWTRADGTHVTIGFRDDGPGFQNAEKAFDPFYTTKDVGKGTGLGLSVCYGIVEEHQGEITAANWENGARIVVTLPIGEPGSLPGTESRAAEPRTELAVSRTPAEKLRALVVDDEEMLLRLQVSFLAKMGIQATGVLSGELGIEHLETHEVDLVVSDVRMPGSVDGMQLFEWVRTNRSHLASRFVFVSGDLVGLNLGDFFRRTPVMRVEKPFRFDEYAAVIRQVIQSGGLQP